MIFDDGTMTKARPWLVITDSALLATIDAAKFKPGTRLIRFDGQRMRNLDGLFVEYAAAFRFRHTLVPTGTHSANA